MATKTRSELEAEHVAAGVAKWGESERAGLVKQARAKSLDTLRLESEIRAAEAASVSEAGIREVIDADAARHPETTQYYQASGALDESGLS